MSVDQSSGRDVASMINQRSYNAERLSPHARNPLYLHLSDLRMALEFVRTDERLSLLDYGSGGSPYASLFPNAVYRRADFLHSEGLDYVLGADSRVPEADETFDLILSTQVLEHVERPDVFLSECRRLLKPSGRVILTTHGTFPDHGCPYDYQRWTADGLRLALGGNGFRVLTVRKLTCGPRALFCLLEGFLHLLYAQPFSLFGVFLKLVRVVLGRFRVWFNRGCDRYFEQYRIREAGSPGGTEIYIGLFVVAEKE